MLEYKVESKELLTISLENFNSAFHRKNSAFHLQNEFPEYLRTLKRSIP